MKRFEQATSKPYGYLVVDLKASTPEQDRLRSDIFPNTKQISEEPKVDTVEKGGSHNGDAVQLFADDDEEFINDDDDDDLFVNGKKRQTPLIGPPGKRFHEEIKEERSRSNIWERRFKEPLRNSHREQFDETTNHYLEQGNSLNEAVLLAANDELPYLRKLLRGYYARFLIDFYTLQDDIIQQQVLQSAKKLRRQHDMNVPESIRQAVKLRKDLFETLWPGHVIEGTNNDSDADGEDDINDDDESA